MSSHHEIFTRSQRAIIDKLALIDYLRSYWVATTKSVGVLIDALEVSPASQVQPLSLQELRSLIPAGGCLLQDLLSHPRVAYTPNIVHMINDICDLDEVYDWVILSTHPRRETNFTRLFFSVYSPSVLSDAQTKSTSAVASMEKIPQWRKMTADHIKDLTLLGNLKDLNKEVIKYEYDVIKNQTRAWKVDTPWDLEVSHAKCRILVESIKALGDVINDLDQLLAEQSQLYQHCVELLAKRRFQEHMCTFKVAYPEGSEEKARSYIVEVLRHLHPRHPLRIYLRSMPKPVFQSYFNDLTNWHTNQYDFWRKMLKRLDYNHPKLFEIRSERPTINWNPEW